SSASAKAYPVARTRPAATVDFPDPEIPMTTMWVVLTSVPLSIMGSWYAVAATRYPAARTRCSPVQFTSTGSRSWVRVPTTQHGCAATLSTGLAALRTGARPRPGRVEYLITPPPDPPPQDPAHRAPHAGPLSSSTGAAPRGPAAQSQQQIRHR